MWVHLSDLTAGQTRADANDGDFEVPVPKSSAWSTRMRGEKQVWVSVSRLCPDEEEFEKTVDYMADHLRRYGWEYAVIAP